MKIQDLNYKKVCILGFGREGQATLRAVQQFAPEARITVADANTNLDIQGVEFRLGEEYMDELEVFEVIIKTPGIRPNPELDAVASKITNAAQLFFDTVTPTGATLIGVTGSKGKSTTSNLTYHALKAGDKDVYLVGNIGIPMLDYLDKATKDAIFVVELSSYQLNDMNVSPPIAVLTSFFPEHMTYHGTMENYQAAKTNIVRFQRSNDTVFYNDGYPECKQMADQSPGKKVAFNAGDFSLPIQKTKLKGEHNRSNMAAALLVATHLGVPKEVAVQAIATTSSLPHRLEPVGTYAGIEWIDDAFSTAPDSTLAALKALGDNVDTLLMGGVDRGYDFSELAKHIAGSDVRNLVLFPDSGPGMQQLIESYSPASKKNYFVTSDMQDAVAFAAKHTEPGKIAVLSSGGPSFNLFKDFVERGEAFAKAVKSLK